MPQINFPELAQHLLAINTQRRCMIAIAGPPASGKSTLAQELSVVLNAARSGCSAVLPMDGFHYDDCILAARGTLLRKGAPETFDVDGLVAVLDRIAPANADVAVPVFDRSIEVARAAARIIESGVRIVIVEGNYLLLDLPGWRELARRFDLTVMLTVSEPELRERLTRRWRDLGLDAETVKLKVEQNDLPNGLFVTRNSKRADYDLGVADFNLGGGEV